MPADYKNAGKTKPRASSARRTSRTPVKKPAANNYSWKTGLWGFLFGGVIGILATIFLLPRPAPVGCPAMDAPAAECPDVEPVSVPKLVEPEYDFYHLLPKLEVVVPQTPDEPASKPSQKPAQEKTAAEKTADPKPQQANRKPEERAASPATGGTGHTYLIQAGSFKSAADAERQRARLALLGFRSETQAALIDANTTWHRVRIGPFQSSDEIRTVRERLNSSGIESLLIRVN